MIYLMLMDSLNDNLEEWIDFEEIKHTAETVRFPEELPGLKADRYLFIA